MQWSELQRDPKSVAEQTDKGAVRVRRRGKTPLLLLQEDEVALATEGAATAARALRGLLKRLDADEIAAMLSDTFSWVDVLPEDDRKEFATDFGRAFEVAAELERWNVLTQTVREWKATAAVHADPALNHALSVPLDEDHGPVPAPEADE